MKRFVFVVGVLAAASLISGCGIKEEVYVRETSALKDQISGLERQKADLVAQREKLNSEIARVRQEKALLSQEKGELSTDLQGALDRVEELRLQAEARKAKLAELRSKLDEMVAAGKLTVRTDKGRMIVEMGEQILFDSGRFKLKPEGAEALTQLTAILVGIQGRVFQVAGHTDSVGSDEKNWRLSANRALEVSLYMIEAGMPPDRISAVGYGETQPVGDNETPEGRALNRRIEVVLQPNIDEILGFTD